MTLISRRTKDSKMLVAKIIFLHLIFSLLISGSTLAETKRLTLIPLEGAEKVILIDSNHKLINSWKVDANRAYLSKEGILSAIQGTTWARNNKKPEINRRTFVEYNWQGEEVRKFENNEVLHHDFLIDDQLVYLLTYEFNPSYRAKLPKSYNLYVKQFRNDRVIAINQSKEAVWGWSPEDFSIDSCGFKKCRDNIIHSEGVFSWVHINSIKVIPDNKHYTQGYDFFKPGNLLLTARNWQTFFILDPETKEIVWDFKKISKVGLSGGHEAQMIPFGYPGAGNFLVFDNGSDRHREGSSIIKELNPVTGKVVWEYKNPDFFSLNQGSVQRLANGNTLISSDYQGWCFEVTPNKEITWEFKTKYRINRCSRVEQLSSSILTSQAY